jgi:hypothetical protein
MVSVGDNALLYAAGQTGGAAPAQSETIPQLLERRLRADCVEKLHPPKITPISWNTITVNQTSGNDVLKNDLWQEEVL